MVKSGSQKIDPRLKNILAFFFTKGFKKITWWWCFPRICYHGWKARPPKYLGHFGEDSLTITTPCWLSIKPWLVNKVFLFHGFLLFAKKNWVVQSSVQCFCNKWPGQVLVCAHLIMGKPCPHSLHLWYQIMIGFCDTFPGQITQSMHFSGLMLRSEAI